MHGTIIVDGVTGHRTYWVSSELLLAPMSGPVGHTFGPEWVSVRVSRGFWAGLADVWVLIRFIVALGVSVTNKMLLDPKFSISTSKTKNSWHCYFSTNLKSSTKCRYLPVKFFLSTFGNGKFEIWSILAKSCCWIRWTGSIENCKATFISKLLVL